MLDKTLSESEVIQKIINQIRSLIQQKQDTINALILLLKLNSVHKVTKCQTIKEHLEERFGILFPPTSTMFKALTSGVYFRQKEIQNSNLNELDQIKVMLADYPPSCIHPMHYTSHETFNAALQTMAYNMAILQLRNQRNDLDIHLKHFYLEAHFIYNQAKVQSLKGEHDKKSRTLKQKNVIFETLIQQCNFKCIDPVRLRMLVQEWSLMVAGDIFCTYQSLKASEMLPIDTYPLTLPMINFQDSIVMETNWPKNTSLDFKHGCHQPTRIATYFPLDTHDDTHGEDSNNSNKDLYTSSSFNFLDMQEAVECPLSIMTEMTYLTNYTEKIKFVYERIYLRTGRVSVWRELISSTAYFEALPIDVGAMIINSCPKPGQLIFPNTPWLTFLDKKNYLLHTNTTRDSYAVLLDRIRLPTDSPPVSQMMYIPLIHFKNLDMLEDVYKLVMYQTMLRLFNNKLFFHRLLKLFIHKNSIEAKNWLNQASNLAELTDFELSSNLVQVVMDDVPLEDGMVTYVGKSIPDGLNLLMVTSHGRKILRGKNLAH